MINDAKSLIMNQISQTPAIGATPPPRRLISHCLHRAILEMHQVYVILRTPAASEK